MILTTCRQIAEGAVGEGEGVLRAGAARPGPHLLQQGAHVQVLDKIFSGSPNIFTVKIFIPSTGKGISHTLARRAAFFLSQGEHSLAVRDLNIALEYGGQGGCVVLSVQLLYCE